MVLGEYESHGTVKKKKPAGCALTADYVSHRALAV
jgi:hypothetical protein